MARELSRRHLLSAGSAASLSLLMSGCGFGIGSSRTSTGATIWDISTGSEQELLNEVARRFNARYGGPSVTVQYFQNDPYKNRLRTSMISGTPPEVFHNWGGGQLKAFVDAGEAAPIPPSVGTDRYFPSVMNAVTFDGRVYSVPKSGTAPKVFFYNTDLFAEHGLRPPATWSDLLEAVEVLSDAGLTPISLAGQNLWTNMMYLEYLVNRLADREPLQAVLAGEPGAWSHPAFERAVAMIQELVAAGAFPDGFAAINADTNQDTQLVYSGRAAMLLQGAWNYQRFVTDAPDFAADRLGWFPFPRVEGAGGSPDAVAGNLTNFYGLTSASQNREHAVAFLDEAIMNDYMVDRLIGLGLAPPVTGIEDRLARSDRSDWLLFIYRLVEGAPYFDLSWDQALPPEAAQELLTNMGRVFARSITPEQFAQRMNQTLEP
ncbi:extracellular solute-binding protein [Streptomonospora sp. PA3]|uniref:extracellular solute-binding protein n=1 Tax=Streptomonospora sp. PA3 TaxID=2607326 RepID=UPI0012DCF484|nr:extracellular solute-binding protein [Streptomonospora sp. PA3]MUL44307.1 extracellular solute-binding protein [Streptomonospora sp. PA3]